MKLKPSKPYAMKVVPHRPWRTVGLWLTGGAVSLALIAGAYWLGQESIREQSLPLDEAVQLREQIQSGNLASAELKKQLASAQLAANVDRQALEELRQQLLVKHEQMAEIEREVSLLRLMSSKISSNAQGVGFGAFSVKPIDGRDYQFRLVIHKLAETADVFKGSLETTLVGKEGGKPKQYMLKDLILDDPKQAFVTAKTPVDFKYFQTFELNVRLPESFEPEYLVAKLVSNARNPLVVEQRLEWLHVSSL